MAHLLVNSNRAPSCRAEQIFQSQQHLAYPPFFTVNWIRDSQHFPTLGMGSTELGSLGRTPTTSGEQATEELTMNQLAPPLKRITDSLQAFNFARLPPTVYSNRSEAKCLHVRVAGAIKLKLYIRNLPGLPKSQYQFKIVL